jgi:hypothetical protein
VAQEGLGLGGAAGLDEEPAEVVHRAEGGEMAGPRRARLMARLRR